ncbi:MAG: MmgE/PrpD family protein [Phycisphaerales bacterium]|nr:MAG: MmgE/PrpD family protein [Phycisphaerales bacterium]
MPTITHRLSEWAAGLRFEALTDDAVDAAKRFLYDSLGCALGGYQQEDCRIMLSYAKGRGGNEEATCIGSGFRTNVCDAALLNALMIRAMDFNDIYWKQDPSHPTDIIPAAMSIVEWKKLSGRELIVGIVLGHEMEMRWCEAAVPGIRERGWHHAALTSFVSPMVASRMLGLSPEQMQHAIGISASPSMCLGAVTAGKLTMMKNTVDPMATQTGVRAALLAQFGYTGPEHVVDGKEGIMHCLGPEWDLGKLTDGLGARFKIVDCGMKAFPVEALTHSPLTAALRIVHNNDFGPDDIEQIIVETIARAADILTDPAKYRPTSKETADHSMPYCLAAGIMDGKVTPEQFKIERIKDPALIPLMDKIKAVGNEEFEKLFPEKQPSRVTIKLKDGRSFSERVDVPKGDYRDPMTMDEIKVKFDALAAPLFGESHCDKIRQAVLNLDKMDTVDNLIRLLVRK